MNNTICLSIYLSIYLSIALFYSRQIKPAFISHTFKTLHLIYTPPAEQWMLFHRRCFLISEDDLIGGVRNAEQITKCYSN